MTDENVRVGIPAHHPATVKVWAWLESLPPQKLPDDDRKRIKSILVDLDVALWSWDG